jgi:hypothetical protein
MQRGGYPIFFPTNGGREPLHVYALIPSIWLFSTTPFAIRVVTATLNLFSVAFLFAFLYNVPQFGPQSSILSDQSQKPTLLVIRGPYRAWLAILGSLALALSYWHITTGRLGLRTELATLLSIPMFWFFLKGWDNRQRRWFVFAGLLMGLLGYTYSAARLLPVILGLALLPEFFPPAWPSIKRGSHREIKPQLTNLLIFVLAAIVSYLPMAWYLYTHPAQFTTRSFSVMIWNFLDTPAGIVAEMGHNIFRIAGFFCCAGSPNPIFGLPEYPGSHPVVLPFLLMGLVAALKNWRLLFPRLVLLWWLIGFIPSIITIEAPHPLRMVLAVVPTAILIAMGPVYLVNWFTAKKSNLMPGRLLLLAVPIILAPVLDNTVAYFYDWTGLQATRGAYDYGAIAIRNSVLEHTKSTSPIYLPLSRLNSPTLLFYLSDHFQRQARLSMPASETALVISPDKNSDDTTWVRLHGRTATILPPLTREGQQLVQIALSSPDSTPIQTADGETIARSARLLTDPVRFVEQPSRPLQASFGPIDLVGVSHPLLITPAGELPVTLFWQTRAQLGVEYDVLLRLVDDDRRVWGNGDGRPTDWVYPTTFWQPSLDQIAARQTITMDAEPPAPGRYWLAVSIFDPTLDQRLPLSAGAGNSPDTLFIGPLKVPLPAPQPTGQTFIAQPITFGEVTLLASFALDKSTLKPGEALQLSLLWRVLTRPETDYTVFVHLLDANNNLVAGNDAQPLQGRYPTTIWAPGERILDKHTLTTPDNLAPGEYRLAIGLYHQLSGARLPLQFPDGQEDPRGRFILERMVTVQ